MACIQPVVIISVWPSGAFRKADFCLVCNQIGFCLIKQSNGSMSLVLL